MKHVATTVRKPLVAVFHAGEDAVEMVQWMLDGSGFNWLVGCDLTNLKKGAVDFARCMYQHDPEVVIFDISPPDLETWQFVDRLLEGLALKGRGVVVTTTNKDRLEELAAARSEGIEIVEKSDDLEQVQFAIHAALKRSRR